MMFDVGSFSLSGPRSVNEDRCAIWRPSPSTLIVAVADGLGGMGSGDIASQIALDVIDTEVARIGDGVLDLERVALEAHIKIRELQNSNETNASMATTLTASYFCESKLWGIHCGDSRAVIARGMGIRRLTKDQTEAQRLLDSGKLSKGEYFAYPRRHILESALGVNGKPKLQKFEFDTEIGDKLFFTTDGVHEKVYLRELRSLAEQSGTAEEVVRNVKQRVEEVGPEDNYTMVCVCVLPDSGAN